MGGCKHSTNGRDLSEFRMSLINRLGCTPSKRKLERALTRKETQLSSLRKRLTKSPNDAKLQQRIRGVEYQLSILKGSLPNTPVLSKRNTTVGRVNVSL